MLCLFQNIHSLIPRLSCVGLHLGLGTFIQSSFIVYESSVIHAWTLWRQVGSRSSCYLSTPHTVMQVFCSYMAHIQPPSQALPAHKLQATESWARPGNEASPCTCTGSFLSMVQVLSLTPSNYSIVEVWHWCVASSPGPSQILSRGENPIFLHGCEIKSGRGLGTRLVGVYCQRQILNPVKMPTTCPVLASL